MEYISTRGHGPVSFTETLLQGLAPDGGLYLPTTYPPIANDFLAQLPGMGYRDIAFEVMAPFVAGEVSPETLRKIIHAAADSFVDKNVTPVSQLSDDIFMLELFHGPTLAFKDVALQFLSRLLDDTLEHTGGQATVVGATSGDTGPAAMAALAGRRNIRCFIMFPHNRVSDIQRKQMTTLHRENIFPIAIEGTFDDCQAIAKTLLSDPQFRERTHATAINSISWARLMPQIVYYFYAWSRLPEKAREKGVYFCVPTGNFGDIFAGYVAQKMGLPIKKLVLATNENDILVRFINHGDYSSREVTATCAPSIDIQVASNFERFLFDLFNRDAPRTSATMEAFGKNGALPALMKEEQEAVRRIFYGASVTENELLSAIHEAYERYDTLIDPHTAVGFYVALSRPGLRPMVCLATAHPAKFPEAVEKATGVRPQLPEFLADLPEKEERFDVLPNDAATVRAFIETSRHHTP